MPQLNMGGAERVIINIMNHLNRDKFTISLLLFNRNGSLMEDLNSDIAIYSLNICSVAKGIPKLLLKIYQLRPDILFSGIGNLNLYISLFIPLMRHLIPETKWVARQASILTLNNRAEKSPKLYEWLYKRIYKNYNIVICQSKYMQRDLVENYNFPKEQSVVINNPIDIKKINELSNKSIKYPFDRNKIRLISVGGLRYEKRQDLLLKAFAKLSDKYTLTIIGDGIKRDELEKLSKKLEIDNRVVFLGYLKNPYPYIKSADIFLLTSEYEGFPNVLLEANLLKIPVIAFNSIGGVAEIIENGVNGVLVPYKDINTLVETINKTVNKYKGDAIRDRAVKKYSINLIIKKYELILKG
jgi:glycosyltransferase involved in cell wall biosynthesis